MAYSNVTRITGMYSGIDTQAMITSLMNAESMKLNKLKRNAISITWKQELYRSAYTDLKNFQKSFLDVTTAGSFRLSNTFSANKISIKNSSGQDSTAVSVGSGAKAGNYSVKVQQLAAASLYESASKVGGVVKSQDGFKFDVRNIKSSASYEITLDGATKKVSFKEGDAVQGGTLTFSDGSIGIKDASGAVKKLNEQEFVDVFNEKLKNAFGTEGVSQKGKIEAKLTASGGISITTNGNHSGFSIADGTYVFGIQVAQHSSALGNGKTASTGRPLAFNIKVGNVSTFVDVAVTPGMDQGELLKALNDEMEEKGLSDKLFFSLDTLTGNIKFTNFSASEVIEISDGVNGSMAYLGYDRYAVAEGKSLLATGPSVQEQDRILEFALVLNDNTNPDDTVNGPINLSVAVTKGMTQDELIKLLNQTVDQALDSKGLKEQFQFSLDDQTGHIKITNLSASTKIELSDKIEKSQAQPGGPSTSSEKLLTFLGFENKPVLKADSVSLLPSSPLGALGITSGSASEFSTDSTLSEIFGSELTQETSFVINDQTFSFNGNTKLSDLMDQVNNANLGVTLRYDSYNEVFQLESNETGYVNKISISGALLTDNLGFGTTAKVEAADAVATINGITVTRATNSFEFQDANWTLNRVTADNDDLSISVSRDTDEIVNKIKEFVTGYNELVEKLNSLTGTMRPKSNGDYYEPLLDEEKSELSEKDLELWEEKAKTGLLYRDGILVSITQQLRSVFSQSVEMEDGSKLSLSSIGITTGDWRDNGKLVIDEDKLRKAIEERGDDIATLFTKETSGIAERLNSVLNSAVSKSGSIANRAGIQGSASETSNTLYNQLKSQNDTINRMISRLADREDYYYKMFARMESAMAQADSQLSYLSSMLGS